MDGVARSRLLVPLLPRISARSFSAASPASEPAAAAAAVAASDAAAATDYSSSAGDPSSAPPPPARKPLGLLKGGVLAVVAAAFGATGYVSYAYSLDEIDQRTREFRKNSKQPIRDDLSGFEKFQAMAYSAAMKVPVAAIEFYLDTRSQIEDQIRGFSEPSSDKLLPDLLPQEQHVFTLVLDLNETLVYSDWKRERGWRTFKRPGVDAFLEHLGKFYEIVVYSDQLSMYVDPVIERLDPKGCVRHRLSRVATKYENGKHYRDLSKLNRNPAQVIYISGHALESCLQPENCVEIKPWKLENDDTQLLDLIPFLEYVAMARPSDIRAVLASYQGRDIPAEFIERSKEHQRSKSIRAAYGGDDYRSFGRKSE
uniref:Mitochondrial import inner membrane translocase subunit TIM50 n=1 Tax=Oryza nivara TaxID=4536 RepID=A0A0E0FTI0_ORYNI